MRILSFDPGAKRMGWAVLEDGWTEPVYVASGVEWVEPLVEGWPTQRYAHHLREYWVTRAQELFNEYQPDVVANETLPTTGFGSGAAGVQSILAGGAISAVQVMAIIYELPVTQVAAVTIKARIGGKKTATKVKVRDGVFNLLPELASRKKEWVKIFEEPDAIGVGLVALGFTNK